MQPKRLFSFATLGLVLVAACFSSVASPALSAERPNILWFVVDDMSGATPKKSKYNELLRNQHRLMRRIGSALMPTKKGQGKYKFDSLMGAVKIVNSRDFELIQVADIAAYNIFRQFAEHGEAWEDHTLVQLPLYPYFGRLVTKFRQGPRGRIQGFGVVKLSEDQVEWEYIDYGWEARRPRGE